MKLAILDGRAVNPGDLSWDSFNKFADVSVYQETPADLVTSRIGDSEAILLNKIIINSEVLKSCKNLKYIGVLATGYNVIDIDAVKKAGICVTNIPAYSTMAVAQHVFALIMHFSNHVALHNDSVQNGNWIKSPIFCYWEKPLIELSGKTLGILGYGNIGKQVEKIGISLGMNVIVCPHRPNGNKNCVTQEKLFAESDFLSLHVPMNGETAGIINEKKISSMKDGAYIINTARGGLVDEQAIKAALESKKLAGYAADVISEEPMISANPLLHVENCVLTPHIAWAPLETRKRCMDIGLSNFKSWLSGKPVNTIY